MTNILKFKPLKMSNDLVNGMKKVLRVNEIISRLNSIEQTGRMKL